MLIKFLSLDERTIRLDDPAHVVRLMQQFTGDMDR
jgi:hypothetical protein